MVVGTATTNISACFVPFNIVFVLHLENKQARVTQAAWRKGICRYRRMQERAREAPGEAYRATDVGNEVSKVQWCACVITKKGYLQLGVAKETRD